MSGETEALLAVVCGLAFFLALFLLVVWPDVHDEDDRPLAQVVPFPCADRRDDWDWAA